MAIPVLSKLLVSDILGPFTKGGVGPVAQPLSQIVLKSQPLLHDFSATPIVEYDPTVPGSGTNIQPILQAAATWAATEGRTVRTPAGRYRIEAPGVYIDETATTGIDKPRASLEGDGTAQTFLYAGSGDFTVITFAGATADSGLSAQQQVRGITFHKIEGTLQGIGLLIQRAAFCGGRDLRFYGFNVGLYGIDVLTSHFELINARNNNIGSKFERGTLSYPNALTFTSCSFGTNYEWGLSLHGAGSIGIVGGSIEGNGSKVGPGPYGGLRLSQCGPEGTFINIATHFEVQAGASDILIENSTNPVTYNITSTFFRFINGAGWISTNNIKIEHVIHRQTLNLVGTQFREFGGFVPSASQDYVAVVNPTEPHFINDVGVSYPTAAAAPKFTGSHSLSEGMIAGQGVINVDGTIKNATKAQNFASCNYVSGASASYTVNFEKALKHADYQLLIQPEVGTLCVPRLLGKTTGAFAVQFYTPHTGAVVASAFAFTIIGGGV